MKWTQNEKDKLIYLSIHSSHEKIADKVAEAREIMYLSGEYSEFYVRPLKACIFAFYKEIKRAHDGFMIPNSVTLIKDVIGYEGLYKITPDGDLFSKLREGTKGIVTKSLTKDGYYDVRMSKDGKQTSFLLHRLIAIHFIPNPGNKPQVNHKNGVRNDNRIENLEWATQSENIQHAFDTGLMTCRGAINPNSKLTEEDVIEIRELLSEGIGYLALSKKYNVSKDTIGNIKNRKNWTHI